MKTNPTTDTIATSGPGAAHIGLFGRPTLHRAPEGDVAAGGAAAAAPPSPTTTATTPGTPPAGGAPRTFTQEEVNAIVAERVARVKTSAPAAPAAQAPAAPELATSTGTGDDVSARVGNMEFRALFHEQLADFHIPKANREDAMQLARAQLGPKPTPQAMQQWFETKGKIFGASTSATTDTTTTSPTNPANPVAAAPVPPSPAAASAPSKVDPLAAGGLVDITSLAPEQIESLGPQGLRQLHERNLAVARRQSGQPALPRMGSARKD